MSALGALLLAASAGLNPWLVLLLVMGLAAFTQRAAVDGPLEGLAGIPQLVAVALLLGLELVVSKVRRTAEWTERVNLVAAGVVGGLLASGLVLGTGESSPLWLAAPGAMTAMVARLIRRRAARSVREVLRPWGHVVVGMASDVLAGAATAALFLVKP